MGGKRKVSQPLKAKPPSGNALKGKGPSSQAIIADCPPEERAPVVALDIGDVIEFKYRLIEKLGEGGMGAVFLAEDMEAEKEVAIKVILPSLVGRTAVQKRFLREARLGLSLKHPNVVEGIDLGEYGAYHYFVMEYLKGETLEEILGTSKAPVDPVRIVPILIQVCDGLHAAHSTGIIHRDLKPDNIFLLEEGGGVKLIDLGLAKPSEESEFEFSRITKTDEVFGTPHYMAPEQIRGKECDARTDVYALGAVLYRLITGRTPFNGTTAGEIFGQHFSAQPRDPTYYLQVVDDLTDDWYHGAEALGMIALRAMLKDPADRIQDMMQFKRALGLALTASKSVRSSGMSALAEGDPALRDTMSNMIFGPPQPSVGARLPSDVIPRYEKMPQPFWKKLLVNVSLALALVVGVATVVVSANYIFKKPKKPVPGKQTSQKQYSLQVKMKTGKATVERIEVSSDSIEWPRKLGDISPKRAVRTTMTGRHTIRVTAPGMFPLYLDVGPDNNTFTDLILSPIPEKK